MTAIVGIVEKKEVWIGGDSAGVGGLSIDSRTEPKVFQNGEFLIGFTTSFRMGQLLEFEFNPPGHNEGESGIGFMVRKFIPEVISCLRGGGFLATEDGRVSGGSFLVGHRGELFEVDDDFQVFSVRQGFHAVGCGTDIALGSLHTSQGKLPAKKRIKAALKAAAEFSAGVRGPFTILRAR